MAAKSKAKIKEVPTDDDSIQAIKKKLGAKVYVKTGLGRRFVVNVSEGGKRPSLIALHL